MMSAPVHTGGYLQVKTIGKDLHRDLLSEWDDVGDHARQTSKKGEMLK